jgi:hypothetical protein
MKKPVVRGGEANLPKAPCVMLTMFSKTLPRYSKLV